MTCKVGSINQIYECLNENGYLISKYMLRRLVADGTLPAIASGKKLLINYNSVVKLLDARTSIPDRT